VKWQRTIRVPFAPETPLSGIGDATSYFSRVWYRRTFAVPPDFAAGKRLIVHFGAVDYSARVWVNSRLAVEHEGGYTPFSADITDLIDADRDEQVIEVCADDDALDLCKPRGKQDWQLHAHSIWYPRTTGIWQTVWMEVVPSTRIDSIYWEPDVSHSSMKFHARLIDPVPRRDPLHVRVTLRFGERTLADDTFSSHHGEAIRTLTLGDPCVEDFNIDFLWSPDHPHLIDAEVELFDPDGGVVDRVSSYCAMRSIGIEGDRFTLNRRPVYLRFALDQGYWRESGMTPPGDNAIRRDVELAKEMGFNGVRKHQKIEDPRFLYWADRLGLLVWEECPSPYRFDALSIERMTRTWMEAICRDHSHPCIVCWVPFNESWGVPDLPTDRSQRDLVRAMYYATKSLDPTRPCVGNDGWEAVVGDFVAIHDYERDPGKLLARYLLDDDQLEQLFRRQRLGGRVILTSDCKLEQRPILLTEFGGIGFSAEAGAWGYTVAGTRAQLAEEYTRLLRAVRSIPIFAGFCYTQLTDTYQEANGLLTMDRTPKFPIQQIRQATAG
jgi:beta-galactosidase/beta-glucuronidase